MTPTNIALADLSTMKDEIRKRAFSYRTGRGGRRSHTSSLVGGGGGGGSTPLTILGSLDWWVRADSVLTATGVSQMTDLSGNNRHFTQGTGSAQPTLLASDINGQPAVRADGVNDVLNATWARAAPATQPVYFWVICKQVTWVDSAGILGDFVATGCVYSQGGVTPQITLYNNSVVNTNGAGTLGSYFRHEVLLNNNSTDYVKIGATNVTGGAAGNLAGGGTVQLFNIGNSAGGRFGNVAIAEAFAFLGTPTGPQRTSLDAYCTSRYGAGLV